MSTRLRKSMLLYPTSDQDPLQCTRVVILALQLPVPRRFKPGEGKLPQFLAAAFTSVEQPQTSTSPKSSCFRVLCSQCLHVLFGNLVQHLWWSSWTSLTFTPCSKTRCLRWSGHVQRQEDGRLPKDLLYSSLTKDLLYSSQQLSHRSP